MAALQAHLPSFSAGKGTRRNHLLLQRLASVSIEFYNGWLLPPLKKEKFPFACDISPSKNCRPVGTKRVLRLTSMNDFYSTSQRRAVRLLVQHSSLKNTVSLLSSPIENETCSSRRGGPPLLEFILSLSNSPQVFLFVQRLLSLCPTTPLGLNNSEQQGSSYADTCGCTRARLARDNNGQDFGCLDCSVATTKSFPLASQQKPCDLLQE